MIEEEHFGKAKNELWIKCCVSYDKEDKVVQSL